MENPEAGRGWNKEQFTMKLHMAEEKTNWNVREKALKQLEQQNYAILYFRGQTLFYIKKEVVQKLDIVKLTEKVREVYGDTLDGFSGTIYEYVEAFEVELPPDFSDFVDEYRSLDSEEERKAFAEQQSQRLGNCEPLYKVKQLVDFIESETKSSGV